MPGIKTFYFLLLAVITHQTFAGCLIGLDLGSNTGFGLRIQEHTKTRLSLFQALGVWGGNNKDRTVVYKKPELNYTLENIDQNFFLLQSNLGAAVRLFSAGDFHVHAATGITMAIHIVNTELKDDYFNFGTGEYTRIQVLLPFSFIFRLNKNLGPGFFQMSHSQDPIELELGIALRCMTPRVFRAYINGPFDYDAVVTERNNLYKFVIRVSKSISFKD